ncbi:MAG: glycosyltransferase family 2 protein, partial [Candidatus Hydrogenedentota bacterium]
TNGLPFSRLRHMTIRPHSEAPAVTVVITNYNGRRFLADCIDSVMSQTVKPAEIYVVDNASTDGSTEFLTDTYPDVKLLEMGENAGFARAANAGIRESTGDFIALLNNDAVADRYWLEHLLRRIRGSEEIGFCASKMLFSWNKEMINNAGIGLTDYGLAYDRGLHVADGEAFANDQLVFGACGGATLLRRRMLDRIGLFDEDFFLCYDDADLSFRAQLMGYKCMYVANAVVYHAGGATVPYHGKTSRFHSCRHFIIVMAKNMPGQILLRRFGAISWFCLKNTARSFVEHRDLTNLRGYLSGIAAIKRNLKLRKQIQSRAAVTADYIRSMMVSREQMLRETSARHSR